LTTHIVCLDDCGGSIVVLGVRSCVYTELSQSLKKKGVWSDIWSFLDEVSVDGHTKSPSTHKNTQEVFINVLEEQAEVP
jgi:hypothetical protein